MVFTLILSLISTFFYFNMLIAEIYNSKIITASENRNELNALIKFILIVFMGIFWGITIRFW